MTGYEVEQTESKQFRCISIVDADTGEIQVQQKVRKDADLEDLANQVSGVGSLPTAEEVKEQIDAAFYSVQPADP